ncbi:MAG: hypothetical protein Q7K35_01500 [bacterium]|nr:hypothetical protein [bacterium]
MIKIIKKLISPRGISKEEKNNGRLFVALIFMMIIAVFFVDVKFSLAAESFDSTKILFNWGTGTIGALIAMLLGVIAYILTAVIGLLVTVVVAVLIQVAQYANIINVPTVITGWVIIRDLCNMSFILILLIIAFATILRQENFSAKKILPKLLIMAILINFSRSIFGLLIDLSQIVMLTFVNAFAAGGGHIINAVSADKWLTMNKPGLMVDKVADQWATVMAIIASVLAAIITLIVLSVMLAVLVARIVMLWIYTIFSPLIFLGFAFTPLQKYTGKLWEDFTKQLIVGPVLAFFIWLAITTAQSSTNLLADKALTASGSNIPQVCVGAGAFFCNDSLQKFVIVIGLLVGGLMVAQTMGGAAGSIAGKGLNWAKGAIGAPGKLAGWGGKLGMFKAGRSLDTLQMKAQKGVMGGLFKSPDYHPKSLNYRMIASGWDKNRKENLEKYESFGGKGAPLDTVWQETFKKHLQLKQYGTIRKNQSQYIEDKEQAGKLETQNEIDDNRIKFNGMGYKAKVNERNRYKDDAYKKEREAYYTQKGYKGEDEVKKDIEILEGHGFDTPSAEKRIKENESKIQRLKDPRMLGKFNLVSASAAAPFGYVKSKAGAQESIDKAEKERRMETGETAFKVNDVIVKASEEGDVKNIIAGLRIQTRNNNLNEVMQDKRMVDLMTKTNGLLEKLNVNGSLAKGADGKDRVLSSDEMKSLKADVKNRPVTPAHVQAMIRGLLLNAGVKDNVAAGHAADLGERSFAAGNGLAYGMATGDEASGDYKFEHFNFENGRLQTSERRKAAITAKMGNLESQARMRMSHPDLTIAEAMDGSATGLHEDGEYLLRRYSKHDLGQMNRMRTDNIKKTADSEKTLEDIRKLADKVEAEVGKEAADLIRYYGGVIKNSKQGSNELKGYEEAIKAMGGTV